MTKAISSIHSIDVGMSEGIFILFNSINYLPLTFIILQLPSALELINILCLLFHINSHMQSSWNSPSLSAPSLLTKFYDYHFRITPSAPPVISIFSLPQMVYTAAKCSLTVSSNLSLYHILSKLSSPALMRYLPCQVMALTESRCERRVALVTQLLGFMSRMG